MRLIGVTGFQPAPGKVGVNQDYMEAVLRAGGLPVLFPVTEDEGLLERLLDQVDGLVLSGGEDVDPRFYGEEKLPCCGTISPERDRMEFPLCRLALKRDLPVLAICRGVQVLNCALGGTLYQDIAEQFSKTLEHPCYDRPAEPVHEVRTEPGSRLHAILGSPVVQVNSRHHQAIRLPGKGLRVTGRATDGLPEAVELPEAHFVLGVQWHPESLSDRFPEHQRLFDALLRAAGGTPGNR